MQRAVRVIGKLRVAGGESLARAAWPAAVGKRIAARTAVASLVGSRLVVQVEDSVWQTQLFTMREQILARLEHALGERVVDSLEFRVALPRPKPQREESFALSADEADRIASPALRNIYKASRRRATS